MASKYNYSQLASAIALSGALILSGCQPSDQSVEGKYAGGGKGSTELNKPNNGRTPLTPELAKFKVDVTTLEAYKTQIAPLFAKLTASSGVSWDGITKLKTWLIGPMELEKLPGKPLSSTYSVESGDAISRQTAFEVWIDQDATTELNDAQKGELMLQEILTSAYLLRNFKGLELCNLALETNPLNEDCRARMKEGDVSLVQDEMKKINESESKKTDGTGLSLKKRQNQARLDARIKAVIHRHKPLEQADYNKINIVKRYIQQQGEKLTYKDLMKKMGENGFDLRIFTIRLKSAAAAPVETASENIPKL